MIPEIDVMKCTGCGVCTRTCPVGIIGLVNGKASILRDLCEECAVCAFTCPEVAVYSELEDTTDTTTYIAAFPVGRRRFHTTLDVR